MSDPKHKVPYRWLIAPPILVAIEVAIIRDVCGPAMQCGPHSGGELLLALLLVATLLFGLIVESIAVPKTLRTLVQKPELRTPENIAAVVIGTIGLLGIICVGYLVA